MRYDGTEFLRIMDHLIFAKSRANEQRASMLAYLIEMALLEAADCREKSIISDDAFSSAAL